MNKKRLLKLADFLETVPRRKFDLDDWETSAPNKPEGKREGECGFAGCGIGWALHAKLFRDLRGKPNEDEGGKLYPVFNSEEGWDAVAAFFDLTIGEDAYDWYSFDRRFGETERLFSDECYPSNPTPKQVAKRIRKFVESGTIP